MKPLPQPNVVTQRFWSSCAEGRFEFQVCRGCGNRQFPPRLACTDCHRADFDWMASSGRGAIYSFTVVHRAPLDAFKPELPYVIAIVELEEGVRAMMNMRGPDAVDVTIGTPVEVFYERTVEGAPPLPQGRRRS
jgi:uncharacterized OB-fold protein